MPWWYVQVISFKGTYHFLVIYTPQGCGWGLPSRWIITAWPALKTERCCPCSLVCWVGSLHTCPVQGRERFLLPGQCFLLSLYWALSGLFWGQWVCGWYLTDWILVYCKKSICKILIQAFFQFTGGSVILRFAENEALSCLILKRIHYQPRVSVLRRR